MAEVLKAGSYLGITKNCREYNGIILSDTHYSSSDIFPAHSHENLYIAYVTEGNYIERSKGETRRHFPGSVVLHRSDERHSNDNFSGTSRILNAEISMEWFSRYGMDYSAIESNVNRNRFDLQVILAGLYREYVINDNMTHLSIESGLMKMFHETAMNGSGITSRKPAWVKRIREIMYFEDAANMNLVYFSAETGVHAAHISRDFSKHFACSMGEYARRMKVERAAAMIGNSESSLAEISYRCGFSDQSHFTRIFRKYKGLTPQQYRNLTSNYSFKE